MLENRPYLKFLIQGVGFLAAFAAFTLTSLYLAQNKMIYLPSTPIQYPNDNPEGYRDPGERGMLFKDIETVTADNLRLKGWFIHQRNPKKHNTIIFMHENAGNIGLRMDFFDLLYNKLEVNIVTFGYRGYSYSEGNPSEEGLKLDADAIIEYVKSEQEIDQKTVFLQGRSLGGAVAIHTAVKYGEYFKGIIVENTFTSMADMVDKIMVVASKFKGLILKNHWRSIDLVAKIEQPIMYVTGKNDELVPFEMTLELHENTVKSKQKEVYIVFPGTHNDTWMVESKVYVEKLRRFMSDSLVHAIDNSEFMYENVKQKKPKKKKVEKKDEF